jgi:chromosome segregation ATPase
VSELESDLSTAKTKIAAVQQQVRDAEKERDLMEMEKQETQRRFDMLRKALLDLNKKNPADLQINLGTIVDDMGAPAGSGSPAKSAPAASDGDSVKDLLDVMDSM